MVYVVHGVCSPWCALILQRGQTALHIACEGNLAEAVECLVSQGADVGIPDKVRGINVKKAISLCFAD